MKHSWVESWQAAQAELKAHPSGPWVESFSTEFEFNLIAEYDLCYLKCLVKYFLFNQGYSQKMSFEGPHLIMYK